MQIITRIDKKKNWKLIFDRTNWKFGKKHINVLFLSVGCDGLAIPLFFKFLKNKKCGNSNQEDRIQLMQLFIKTFRKKRIQLVLGDRKFIGAQCLNYLIRQKIPFCVRLKEGWQKVTNDKGRVVEIKKCFSSLRKGQIQSLGLRQLGERSTAVNCCITGMRNEKDQWIIVAHTEGLESSCHIYRDRWEIETMFRVMKTGGFNMENTHVTHPERIECLVAIISIAFAICYSMGKWIVAKKPQKLKKHGYKPKTILKKGMEVLSRAINFIQSKPTQFRLFMRALFSNLKLFRLKIVL